MNTAALASDTEILIGDPADPDAIVRMQHGKYRVYARPGLRLTVRAKTNDEPRVRDPIYRLDPPDAV